MNRIHAAELAVRLGDRIASKGWKPSVHVLEEVDSTNTYAKRLAANGEHSALVVARAQTGGRGRMGRSFYSPADSGVYFSILHRLSVPLADAVTMTSAAAVAVMRGVRGVCGLQTEIKWVNDLYYRQKKVCGILAESLTMADGGVAVVIGIGINLRSAELPPELAEIAGTLAADGADEAELIAEIAGELLPSLVDPTERWWLDDYRQCSCVIGKQITWICNGNRFCGYAEDIDENGALCVRSDTGERQRLQTGEITLRLH